jgi:hypothetical protein
MSRKRGLSKKAIDSISTARADVMAYHAELLRINDSGQLITEEGIAILEDMQYMFERLHGFMRNK